MVQCTHWRVYTWGVYFVLILPRFDDVISATSGEKCGGDHFISHIQSVYRAVHWTPNHCNVTEQLYNNFTCCCTCCFRLYYPAERSANYHGR